MVGLRGSRGPISTQIPPKQSVKMLNLSLFRSFSETKNVKYFYGTNSFPNHCTLCFHATTNIDIHIPNSPSSFVRVLLSLSVQHYLRKLNSVVGRNALHVALSRTFMHSGTEKTLMLLNETFIPCPFQAIWLNFVV